MNFINTLHNIPNSCVFVIINPSNKKCYVSYANNLKSRIGQILDDFKELVGPDTYIRILIKVDALLYKQIYAQYYNEQFIEDGYEVVNYKIKYSKYKPKIKVDFLLSAVFVVLENIRKDKMIVGVFDNVDEAKSFVEQYYSCGLVQPVYALNERTKSMVGGI